VKFTILGVLKVKFVIPVWGWDRRDEAETLAALATWSSETHTYKEALTPKLTLPEFRVFEKASVACIEG
jgi:hypothetical protein